MIDIRMKYETINGQEVRLYCDDGGGGLPIHGAIKYYPPKEKPYWTTAEWNENGINENGDDLRLVPPRVQGYLNCYERTPCFNVWGGMHKTIEECKEASAKDCIGFIKIDAEIMRYGDFRNES